LSNSTSPIYLGKAAVRSFAETLRPVDLTVSSKPDEKKSVSVEAQVERARAAAEYRGEQRGFEKGKLQGFSAGYQDGMDVGLSEAKAEHEEKVRQQLDLLVEEVDRLRTSFQANIEQWFDNSENKMTDLAMGAIRKMIVAELTLSRDSALEIVKEALRSVTHSRHARIKVNVFDSVTVREHMQELISISESIHKIDIVTDSSMLGGCIIETDGGVVDASLETKLILLEDSLGRAA
jgi:flagellar assembly protein FliH